MKNLIYLLALAGIIVSCNAPTKTDNKAAANEQKLQRFYDEVINAHNPNAVDSFCTPEFVDHQPSPNHSGKGLDDLKAQFKEFFAEFPDVHFTPNMIVGKGDTVMALVTMTGTHAKTNKQINVQATDVIVLKDGKATDRWGFGEEMKMMGQMGMLPPMPAAGAPSDSAMHK